MDNGKQITYGDTGSSVPTSIGLLLLVALAGVGCLWGLDAGPPLSDHEAIVPQCARQMRQSGDWLIPYFNDVPFIRKTPLQFWFVAAVSYIVDPPDLTPPVSVVSARVPSALAAVLTVLVVYWLAGAMYCHRTALVAGAVAACSGGILFFAHNAQTEMLVTLFIAASMACFYRGVTSTAHRRRYLGGFYVCMGLGMLAKAPLPVVLVGLALFVYWFVTIPLQYAFEEGQGESSSRLKKALGGVLQQVKRLRELWLIPGILIFCALALPWPVYVYLKVDNALELWRTEFIDRYVGLLSHNVRPGWYYIPILFAMTAPFCLSLPEAFAAPFRERFKRERRGMLFAFTWVVVQIVFLSTSAFKRPHYLLPVLPGACLLLGPVIERLFLGAVRMSGIRVRVSIIAIFSGIVVALPFCVRGLAREDPDLVWAIWPIVGLLLGGVGTACYLFWRENRLASLLTLCIMPLVIFAWTWSAVGRSEVDKGEVKVAEALKRLLIGANDRITYAVGRPDARLSYYLGVQIHPLYSPLEMAARRRGRLEVPEDVLLEGAKRIIDRLNSKQEEYFIFEAKELEMLKKLFPVEYREVLRVETEHGDPGEDIVVITNKWNTGEEEDLAGPTTRPGNGSDRPTARGAAGPGSSGWLRRG